MTGRNPVNFKKLPGSKWTAVRPSNREKHFVVVGWVADDEGRPTDRVLVEAILTGARRELHWRELHDAGAWHVGWR